MMRAHGYGPFRRLLLGSVTAKVLHDAHCPVWTGAHMEEPMPLDLLYSKTVLCAVDDNPSSSLMEWAAQYANEARASLRLIHVIPGIAGQPDCRIDQELESAVQTRARQRIARIQNSLGLEIPLDIGAGNVAMTVRDEARRQNADLIVIGRGAIQQTLGRLRT